MGLWVWVYEKGGDEDGLRDEEEGEEDAQPTFTKEAHL